MPQQPGQGVRRDQRCAQEEHGPIQVAEEEEETQGKDVSGRVRPRQPGLRDAEETQESWKKIRERRIKESFFMLVFIILHMETTKHYFRGPILYPFSDLCFLSRTLVEQPGTINSSIFSSLFTTFHQKTRSVLIFS